MTFGQVFFCSAFLWSGACFRRSVRSMGVVNEAVKDRVGVGGISKRFSVSRTVEAATPSRRAISRVGTRGENVRPRFVETVSGWMIFLHDRLWDRSVRRRPTAPARRFAALRRLLCCDRDRGTNDPAGQLAGRRFAQPPSSAATRLRSESAAGSTKMFPEKRIVLP